MSRHRTSRAPRATRTSTSLASVVVLTVFVSLAAGILAVTASGAVPNLVVNSTFEAGTAGWYLSNGGSLTRSTGHASSYAARVTNTTTTARSSTLNDTVNTVAKTTKGVSYTASAWVRTTVPGTATVVRLMEYRGSTYIGKNLTTTVLADTSWRQVTVTYVAGSDGASLDLNIFGQQLKVSASVDIDDVTLVASASPTSTTSSPSPTTSAGFGQAGWTLKWADEFNGSLVDATKWRVRDGAHNPNELSCLTNRPQNVAVSGGVLHIRAQHERYTCGGYQSSWTSGYLDTIGKMSSTYGRFEMRAKLPTQANTSKGMWPAFWLRPNDGGNGEIDIMEAIGSAAGETNYNRVSQTLWYDYHGTYPRQVYSDTLSTGNTMSDGFHTYAVEWESGVIRWLIDGNVTYTRSSSDISWMNSTFSRPFNIRLNLQVGGSWPGTPNADTQFPADYQVDWVHVYQR